VSAVTSARTGGTKLLLAQDPSSSACAGECTLMTKAARPTADDAATSPSTRSITPPWPGINELVSLAPKRRLMADSAKSPACATKESIAPVAASRTAELSGTANQNRAAMIELATSAPTRPAQVLLGETRGHSLGPPISRPVTNPAVSVVMTT